MDTVELIDGWVADGWQLPVILAPVVGSFLGVLIARLPEGGAAWRGVVAGRSACAACGAVLGPAELVPIASFLALRGRCRSCAAPIARFHLWVELAALAVAGGAAAAGERGAVLWAGCGLGWTLLALGWIDARCLRLPDALTLPLLLAGLGEAAWLEPDMLAGRAWGAVLGYAGFSALAWAYRRLRGREGLGQGDAKLLAASGAWVGAAALPDVLLAAALAGLVWAFRHGRPDPLARQPFGPFLALATWAIWIGQ